MFCRNYTGTKSRVLCREVCYTVSLLGRLHYQRIHCSLLDCPTCILSFLILQCVSGMVQQARLAILILQCVSGMVQQARLAILNIWCVSGMVQQVRLAILILWCVSEMVQQARLAILNLRCVSGMVQQARLVILNLRCVSGMVQQARLAILNLRCVSGMVQQARLVILNLRCVSGTVQQARPAILNLRCVSGMVQQARPAIQWNLSIMDTSGLFHGVSTMQRLANITIDEDPQMQPVIAYTRVYGCGDEVCDTCQMYIQWNLLVSTWFSTHSWIVNTPHSVPVYTSCT